MHRRLALVCLLLLLPLSPRAQQSPTPAVALQQTRQEPAILLADQVFITRDRTLVAQGNVEAFQGTTRIRASAIRYSQSAGSLVIEGPIVLSDGEDTTILADAAELTDDLRNGLLTGARMILDQQLQLAALQLNRVEGRYSQLYKAAVTACKVCDDGRPPLWQIRAKRVIHDQAEQQLYFDEATFRIRSVPIFYLPRLRLPDPTLERSRGFLTPSIRTTSQLGVGIKVPYFIPIGRSRDLTVTPYLSSSTRTLELRYRQAFRNGRIEFNGAVTRDDLRPDKTRGYLFGTGAFDLPRDFKLTFALESVSDRAYLTEYGYSDKDRLTSELTVQRSQRDEYIRASFYNIQSLRVDENNDTLPTLVLDGRYERRFHPVRLGGEIRLSLQAHSHRRNSDSPIDGPDPDTVVDGRDVVRINGEIDWLRRYVSGGGLVGDVRLGGSFGFFDITQDNTFAQNHADVVPHASIALRYPLARRGANGVAHLLEPVAQIAWTGGDRLAIPNEESTRVEFDQGNLLALSRFPRPDRRERGTVGALGLSYSRIDPAGWDAHLTFGQVFRRRADAAFSDTSGLTGTSSDLLVAAQLRSGALSLTGRGLFEGDFGVSKAEVRGDWTFRRGRLGGSYVWLEVDPTEDRTQAVSEITLDGAYRINDQWAAAADMRFDTAADRAAVAGLGVTYNNECVTVDLSVRRRYSSSTSVEPSTDIGFNIGLRGFSATTGTERYVRSCRN
jgi:LPS-assembly protein